MANAFAKDAHSKQTREIIETNIFPAFGFTLVQAKPDRIKGRVDLDRKDDYNGWQDQPERQ
jgi:hypothetical protein